MRLDATLLSEVPRLPITAGTWTYPREGGVLCKLPLAKLRVSAPSDFLRAVAKGCDGKTSWADVRDVLGARWPIQDVDTCLETLLAQGLLIEAGQTLAVQAQIGWTPQPLGAQLNRAEDLYALRETVRQRLKADASGVRRLRPQDTPMLDVLRERFSAKTFADRPLTLQATVNVLWSMYGVLREERSHVRRTVPSGGALYGLRWFVALFRPMDDHEPGLYEVGYHASAEAVGELSLKRLPGESDGAWGTLLTPSILDFAHALIYPVADLNLIGKKYGNRSLTLALIEAGHALQNAALAARYEGAATIMRGDTVETEVLSLFSLERGYHPLPAMVLGAKASLEEERLAATAQENVPVRTVPGHSQALRLVSRMAVAGPIHLPNGVEYSMWAGGRSENARIASIKAEAEAWERIGWSTPHSCLEHGKLEELGNAVDPRRLVAYAPTQYARDDFCFAPFSPKRRYPWAHATRAGDGAPAFIMAHCVYALSSLSAADRRRPYTNASTSGVAAYTDLASARSRALVELIERDAFARTWLSGAAPRLIHERELPVVLTSRAARLRQAGYRVSFHALECKHLPVAAVYVQRQEAFFTAITTGAGFTWEEAVESAIAEAESRVQQHHGKAVKARVKPTQIRLAEHHGEYFKTSHGAGRADWFAPNHARARVGLLRAGRPAKNGPQLVDQLLQSGHEVYFSDLTPQGASIGQGRRPLFVARAFVPGLIPIWFGYGTEPLGSCNAKEHLQGDSLRFIHPCT